jgi:hypothetical protein
VPRFNLLDLLAGPDRRSIGGSPIVVQRILRSPNLLPTLVAGVTVPDPLVRMRAADAVEKVAHQRPKILGRYRARFIQIARTSAQPEVQWHMAQLLPQLPLTGAQRTQARRIFRRYLDSSSSIVQTMALDALVRLAPSTPTGQTGARKLLDAADASAFAAVRARARRLRSTLISPAPGRTA